MNYFTLDGHSTTEWGIGLSAGGAFDAPARKGEFISVPGRSGDIWVDGGAYENTLLTYPCWMSQGFSTEVDDFRGFLLAHADKYYRLSDTYHPGEYRFAKYTGDFIATPGAANQSGRFDVTFSCQPQRWLTSGNTYQTLSATTSITNPTSYKAFPKLRITSASGDYSFTFNTELSGSLYLSTITINFTGLTGTIYFDFATMTASRMDGGKVINLSYTVDYSYDLHNGEFALWPGSNEIRYTGAGTCSIAPRWWTV